MNLIAVRDIHSSVSVIPAGQAFHASDVHSAELIAAGMAAAPGALGGWYGLGWPGATVVILASGPSLTPEQCDAVRAWHDCSPDQCSERRAIAVNTTFRRAPWADVLYACDATWWRVYHAEVEQVFHGEHWSQDEEATRDFGVHRIESRALPGLSKTPGVIHQGANSGYQAVGLAVQAGAKKIILLGFDMAGTHWHGRYENGLPNTAPHVFQSWITHFNGLAADLLAADVEVVNCTPGSAIGCFRFAELGQELACLR